MDGVIPPNTHKHTRTHTHLKKSYLVSLCQRRLFQGMHLKVQHLLLLTALWHICRSGITPNPINFETIGCMIIEYSPDL